MLNYLASTTRQWNCGDDFILFGIINVFKKIQKERINWCIHNRTDDLLETFPDIGFGNIWTPKHSLKGFDKVIIAGTPTWHGPNFTALFKELLKTKKQVEFWGIGSYTNTTEFSELDKTVLQSAKVIVRDENAAKCCESISVKTTILPCPCIFASPTEKERMGNRVGVVHQTAKTKFQDVAEDLNKKVGELIKALDCPVICHYTDEYFETIENFKSVYYSYNANDYLDFYNEFDLIISTRLHGALLALSCGIPAILLVQEPNERLSGAAKQIPVLKVSNPESVLDVIKDLDINTWSKEIISFKGECLKRYTECCAWQHG